MNSGTALVCPNEVRWLCGEPSTIHGCRWVSGFSTERKLLHTLKLFTNRSFQRRVGSRKFIDDNGNTFLGFQLMPQLRDGGNRQAEALELLAANTRRQGQASLESCARFNFSVTRSTNCKALVPSPGPSLQRKAPAQ